VLADGTPRPMVVMAVLGGVLTMITGAIPYLQKRFGGVPPPG
jgi:Na+/citrate or Na+/malate symporter